MGVVLGGFSHSNTSPQLSGLSVGLVMKGTVNKNAHLLLTLSSRPPLVISVGPKVDLRHVESVLQVLRVRARA